MNVSAFLSSDTVVGSCINCFVLSLWHHVRGTSGCIFLFLPALTNIEPRPDLLRRKQSHSSP